MEINTERMLDQYVLETYGENFKFRPQQKEVIIDIINSFYDAECDLYLLDAPTGSGKSIIAMIVAGFLSHQKMEGYILASDLALQQQYEKDFSRYKLDWGSIKGVDNYWCVANSERFSLGECRLKNVSYEKAEDLVCFHDCGYLQNRRKAIRSSVSLLNYSFWLIQRNYLEPKMIESGKAIPFQKRDFTICDEAHKVVDIVQNHFSPRVDGKALDKLDNLRKCIKRCGIKTPTSSSVRVRTVINNLFKEDDQERLYALLKEFEIQLLEFVSCTKAIKEYVSKEFPGSIPVPGDWRYALGLSDWVKDMHCKFEDYNHIISQTSTEYIIKNPNQDQVIFNCLDESYMMNRHFHEQSGFKLLMTATMGDAKTFLDTIAAKNAKYFRMDNTFDFSNSPIYYYPKKRMSASEKENTLPWAIKEIQAILEDNRDVSGIIHSGSYEITQRIHNALSNENKKRVLIYKGSDEKKETLQTFASSSNNIIMGPSLLEGLDLAQDKSRFQIFVKIPFPSLGDNFVSAKMNSNPVWYDWKTISLILQGVGRSVRSSDDWALTYILDGCLSDLFKRSRSNFPPDFQKRIVLKDI
jgi:Rad3-related DNA helicase